MKGTNHKEKHLTNWTSTQLKYLLIKRCYQKNFFKRREFPDGPVVGTSHFHGRGPGFDPWLSELKSQKLNSAAKKKIDKAQTR